MRILYLHQYYCPEGGMGNDRSRVLSDAWASAGHAVEVVTSTAYYPSGHEAHRHKCYQHTSRAGVTVTTHAVAYQQAMGYARRMRAFWAFYRRLVQHKPAVKPDIIYASSTPPTVAEAGMRLARKWGVPWVFEVVDVWPDVPLGMGIVPQWLGSLLQWRVKQLYRRASKVVVLSPGMKAQICSHGIAEKHVLVNYNGTDVEHFSPRTALGQDAGRPVRLLYTGAMGKANGLSNLLEALLLLKEKELPAWECQLMGWGSQQAFLEESVEELGLASLVKIMDGVPKQELPHHLHEADVGLVHFAPYPVLQANSANKFYDYLAAGLPVALNYSGWQADMIAQHTCGLSSAQGDMAGYAEVLAHLINDENIRMTMGANGRRLAEQSFDRQRLAAELLHLFVSLA